jgi:hypothetical protein
VVLAVLDTGSDAGTRIRRAGPGGWDFVNDSNPLTTTVMGPRVPARRRRQQRSVAGPLSAGAPGEGQCANGGNETDLAWDRTRRLGGCSSMSPADMPTPALYDAAGYAFNPPHLFAAWRQRQCLLDRYPAAWSEVIAVGALSSCNMQEPGELRRREQLLGTTAPAST